MATKKTSILEKINQTELRIKELVKKRNKELVDIITRFNAISIDNNLLSGFIVFALNPDNKDHPICLLYTSPSPRDLSTSRMPSSA